MLWESVFGESVFGRVINKSVEFSVSFQFWTLFVLAINIAAALVALQGYWRTAGFLAATAFSFNAIKVSMNFALTVAVRVHAALGVRSPYTG